MNILILDKISVVIDKCAKRHYLQFFFTFLLVELLLIITAHIIKNIIDIINIATGKLTPADGSGYNEDFTVTSAPAQPATSAYDELEKAAKFHEAGILSDEEFNKMKANLLEKMG